MAAGLDASLVAESTLGSVKLWPGTKHTYGATSAGATCVCERAWKGPTPDEGRF